MDFIYSIRKIIAGIKTHFLQFPVLWRLAICLLTTIGVGWLNYKAGTDLALTIFYLVPIALATWFVGIWAGGVFSIGSGLTWAVVDFLIARNFRHPTMHLWNGIASVVLFLGFSGLLAMVKRSLATERQLARVDHLTGIPNRRAFFEAAQREVLRSRRHFNPLTIAYIDINDFKGINDKFGHKMGDEVLNRVGKTILTNLRVTDTSGRLGGDEFAILLPFTNERVSKIVLKKVEMGLMGLAKTYEWPIGFSIGALTFLRPPINVEEMINDADRLMYGAKKNRQESFQHEVVQFARVNNMKKAAVQR